MYTPTRACGIQIVTRSANTLADAAMEPEPEGVAAALSLPLVLGRGLFADNATGLRQAIYKCTNRCRLLGYAIVIMGLDRPPAGRPYVAFQLEQLRSKMVDDEFVAVLRDAVAVWDFSILHAKHWCKLGMPARHMPLWYTLPRSAVSPPTALAPAPIDNNEQIDVLLFGSMNVNTHSMPLLLRSCVSDARTGHAGAPRGHGEFA